MVGKYIFFIVCTLGILFVRAASYSWDDAVVVNGTVYGLDIRIYDIHGSCYLSSTSSIEADGHMFGYRTDGGFYLKQQDHSTTPMPIDNNIWAVSYYSELLTTDTIRAMDHIPLCGWYDYDESGGTEIQTPEDFYLAVLTVGYNSGDGIERLGWFHLSLGDDRRLTLLDSGIGINGESIFVGIGPIPEPTSGLLLLFGVAGLALKRNRSDYS